MGIAPEKELMLKALETLISEACQDGFNSSTSVASMVIKGFGLKQDQFLEYFGFDIVGLKSFSRLSNVLNKFAICFNRDNWFYHKGTIVASSTNDIYRLIGMYKILCKNLKNKIIENCHYVLNDNTLSSLEMNITLSGDFEICKNTVDTFVDYPKFKHLKVLFNKRIDNTDKHLIITKAFEEKYSQYFDRLTISWINRE